ncbi:MAG: CBS domain-containing protein [Thermodesulfovibrionales bacterium]|nr:CBS domain-containing protein [Thermodesulfovibrionales bacterium]
MPITIAVRDVKDDNVIYVNENTTIFDALTIMVEKNVWSVVVTRDDFPFGIVTERDMLRRAISKGYDINKMKVKEIASSPLITIDPGAPIGEALNMMAVKGIRRIYLIENGKIIGRVTQTEILKNMLNVMKTLASLPRKL